MKSLIIGGAGFAGTYLACHLKELGHEVVITKMPQERVDLPGISVYELDILEKKDVLELLQCIKPDYVCHLAAQSSVSVSWKNPGLTIDVNVKGSTNVLDAVRKLQKKARVLLVGSGEEYGRIFPEETPVRENNNIRPGNIYAATKACQNMIGRIYAHAYEMEVLMVRAFNHIGPKQSPLFVVSDFCKQAAEIEAGKKEPVIRVGNMNVRREFTHVRDVVRAYALLMERGQAGETYNIGSGYAVGIGEILQIVLEKSKVDIQVEADIEKFRPADVSVVEADISKVQSITGWTPIIGVEQSIQETMDYWRKIVR